MFSRIQTVLIPWIVSILSTITAADILLDDSYDYADAGRYAPAFQLPSAIEFATIGTTGINVSQLIHESLEKSPWSVKLNFDCSDRASTAEVCFRNLLAEVSLTELETPAFSKSTESSQPIAENLPATLPFRLCSTTVSQRGSVPTPHSDGRDLYGVQQSAPRAFFYEGIVERANEPVGLLFFGLLAFRYWRRGCRQPAFPNFNW